MPWLPLWTPTTAINGQNASSTQSNQVRTSASPASPNPHHSGVDMYTLLNNQESSKFDLYLPGKLVASLHYKLEKEKNEVMFIYCEAIETHQSDHHCRELMWSATENVRNRRLRILITCPIALRAMKEFGHETVEAPKQQDSGESEITAQSPQT